MADERSVLAVSLAELISAIAVASSVYTACIFDIIPHVYKEHVLESKPFSKTKLKDLFFPDVKTKARDTVSSRTFQGPLPTQCFIIHYIVLCRSQNTSGTLQYYVVENPFYQTCQNNTPW